MVESDMSSGAIEGSGSAERLSAFVDGELDSASAAEACESWKHDAEARRAWHAYQLIGDVLRSDDLAAGADRNGAFLVALRARLAAEPVVLAPAPLPERPPSLPIRAASAAAQRRSSRWMLGSAIAAGFMLVIGTFAVLRPGTAPAPGVPVASLAGAPSTDSNGPTLREASAREAIDVSGSAVVNARVVRDARLDRYLAAHKQFSGSSALGVPSAFLRSSTLDAEAR
jgi:sigma-E factor negative regulatory protein RseA